MTPDDALAGLLYAFRVAGAAMEGMATAELVSRSAMPQKSRAAVMVRFIGPDMPAEADADTLEDALVGLYGALEGLDRGISQVDLAIWGFLHDRLRDVLAIVAPERVARMEGLKAAWESGKLR